MIDQNLITKSVSTVTASLNNAKKINNQLLLINNVFPQPVFDKIKTILDYNVEWKSVQNQLESRKMIDWIPESIIEELHIVGQQLTAQVCQCYNINDIYFQALQLWKDESTYVIKAHQDNPVIDVAMQIYLFNDKQSEGTTFIINDQEINCPFKQNTGYVLWKKSNKERILHRITNKITGSDRITLYLTWSRFGKQAPNANNPTAWL